MILSSFPTLKFSVVVVGATLLFSPPGHYPSPEAGIKHTTKIIYKISETIVVPPVAPLPSSKPTQTPFKSDTKPLTASKATPALEPSKPPEQPETSSPPIESTGSEAPSSSESSAEITPCQQGTFNTQFLCLLNQYRESKSKGLNAVSFDSALNLAASNHSTWMSSSGKMDHIGQDGSTFTERCGAVQTTCDAENIAMGFSSAQSLFNAWRNSPGHDANMLGSHTSIGLSLVENYSTLVLR